MEVSGAGEESVCQVQVVLTDLDCTLDQGDGRTISVSMGLLAQAVVRDTRTLELLTDVYSTAYPLTAERRAAPSAAWRSTGSGRRRCGRSWRPANWPRRCRTPM